MMEMEAMTKMIWVAPSPKAASSMGKMKPRHIKPYSLFSDQPKPFLS